MSLIKAQRKRQRTDTSEAHICAQQCIADDGYRAVRLQLENLAKLLGDRALELATPKDALMCVGDDVNALCRTRTYDPLIKSQLLCQLS